MTVSVFELFRIGVGPSSSHTVGPMRAAYTYAQELRAQLQSHHETLASTAAAPGDGNLAEAAEAASHRSGASAEHDSSDVSADPDAHEDDAALALAGGAVSQSANSIAVILYGSLAATGAGHGTLGACLLGLDGNDPATADPDYLEHRLEWIRQHRMIHLAGDESFPIQCGFEDIILRPAVVRSIHTNAVTFSAFIPQQGQSAAAPAFKKTYYSIGGGFIRTAEEVPDATGITGPFAFRSGRELLDLACAHNTTIAGVQRLAEGSIRSDDAINRGLDEIINAMEDCAKRGVTKDGTLPGGLNVRRRAKRWYEDLVSDDALHSPQFALDWVNLVALAVNEENAAGGRVVTAPTNGAAGIIPAVGYYARTFTPLGKADPQEAGRRFLLAAAAVGSLYKERASISGAEVGCQGEVGSAASMAAAGLAEVLGGSPDQVENAAEIAMEHSLGLTCDPISGLVQVPCIERNAISAVKAINSATMALRGDGQHRVTLDEVIETMRETGRDMSDRYKETAGGGLALHVAVNIPEC